MRSSVGQLTLPALRRTMELSKNTPCAWCDTYYVTKSIALKMAITSTKLNKVEVGYAGSKKNTIYRFINHARCLRPSVFLRGLPQWRHLHARRGKSRHGRV